MIESKGEWLTAAEAVTLLKPVFDSAYAAKMTICERAHAGLIRARAQQFMVDERPKGECEVPKEFWWAEGHAALEQKWPTGDFETWLRQRRLKAFGVSFFRADIEKMIPVPLAAILPETPRGGRPKADFWEDLWIEICRQLYDGDLQPKTQSAIEQAMLQWISDNGFTAGTTAVRDRARKLWRVIGKAAS